jgi:hypothetical protein
MLPLPSPYDSVPKDTGQYLCGGLVGYMGLVVGLVGIV